MADGSLEKSQEASLEEAGYLRLAVGGRLQMRRCRRTGRALEYGQRFCACCNHDDIEFAEAPMIGTIVSIVWYHRTYADSHPAPYNVAVVRLDDGPEVVGSVQGLEMAEDAVGDGVEIEILRSGALLFRRIGPRSEPGRD